MSATSNQELTIPEWVVVLVGRLQMENEMLRAQLAATPPPPTTNGAAPAETEPAVLAP